MKKEVPDAEDLKSKLYKTTIGRKTQYWEMQAFLSTWRLVLALQQTRYQLACTATKNTSEVGQLDPAADSWEEGVEG